MYANRYRGQRDFKIATFEEQLLLILELNHSTGRDVGLYPEVKSPKWHQQQGHDISQRVIDLLRKYRLDKRTANIYLQCFDFRELKRIRHQLNGKLKLVQLLGENDWQESDTDYDYLRTAKGMAEIAAVAQGVGPWFPQLFVNPLGVNGQLSSWVSEAKKHQLLIHPYTHRVDQLPTEMSSQQLLDRLFNEAGVDGIFTDFPDTVRRYRGSE